MGTTRDSRHTSVVRRLTQREFVCLGNYYRQQTHKCGEETDTEGVCLSWELLETADTQVW